MLTTLLLSATLARPWQIVEYVSPIGNVQVGEIVEDGAFLTAFVYPEWSYALVARPCDINKDGFCSAEDFDTFALWFSVGDPRADFDKNSFVNGDDWESFVLVYEAGASGVTP